MGTTWGSIGEEVSPADVQQRRGCTSIRDGLIERLKVVERRLLAPEAEPLHVRHVLKRGGARGRAVDHARERAVVLRLLANDRSLRRFALLGRARAVGGGLPAQEARRGLEGLGAGGSGRLRAAQRQSQRREPAGKSSQRWGEGCDALAKSARDQMVTGEVLQARMRRTFSGMRFLALCASSKRMQPSAWAPPSHSTIWSARVWAEPCGCPE